MNQEQGSLGFEVLSTSREDCDECRRLLEPSYIFFVQTCGHIVSFIPTAPSVFVDSGARRLRASSSASPRLKDSVGDSFL